MLCFLRFFIYKAPNFGKRGMRKHKIPKTLGYFIGRIDIDKIDVNNVYLKVFFFKTVEYFRFYESTTIVFGTFNVKLKSRVKRFLK